jgi:hypothetical protein
MVLVAGPAETEIIIDSDRVLAIHPIDRLSLGLEYVVCVFNCGQLTEAKDRMKFPACDMNITHRTSSAYTVCFYLFFFPVI